MEHGTGGYRRRWAFKADKAQPLPLGLHYLSHLDPKHSRSNRPAEDGKWTEDHWTNAPASFSTCGPFLPSTQMEKENTISWRIARRKGGGDGKRGKGEKVRAVRACLDSSTEVDGRPTTPLMEQMKCGRTLGFLAVRLQRSSSNVQHIWSQGNSESPEWTESFGTCKKICWRLLCTLPHAHVLTQTIHPHHLLTNAGCSLQRPWHLISCAFMIVSVRICVLVKECSSGLKGPHVFQPCFTRPLAL